MPESKENQLRQTQEAWLRESLPKAVAFARSLVREHDLAEDLVHDCVCRLLAKAGVYDLPRDGVKLLFRAVTNTCINASSRRRPVVRLHDPKDPESSAEHLLTDRREPAPIDQVMTGELRAAVDAAMDALPVQQRAAIELKSLGHSLAEIGEALAVTANQAGVLVHRARQALRQSLQRHLEERA